MHTRSGLLEAINASPISLQEAGRQTLEFLREHIPEARTVPLCGNSIGTDRRFLVAQLPEVDNWFHYRSVDVSTIKELCRRWYPDALAAAPAKATNHRAMDDIKESVAELAYYRRAIFRAGEPASALTNRQGDDQG
jgi:oligoribonuclease